MNSGGYNLGQATGVIRVSIALLILLVLSASLTACNNTTTQPGTTPLTLNALEEEYGLRVNLIAVTAGGGLVDLRFKILDAGKAKLLLNESNAAPTLLVDGQDVVLAAPQDSTGQLFNSLEDNGNLFLIYPNVASAVKPGVMVTVQFGDVRLEPIAAR